MRLWTNPRWVLLFFAGFSLLCPLASRAQSPVAGSYVCAQVSVAGKSAKCTSPPLILNSDGSYQLRGAEGHYSVRGQWLVLSKRPRAEASCRPGIESFSGTASTASSAKSRLNGAAPISAIPRFPDFVGGRPPAEKI